MSDIYKKSDDLANKNSSIISDKPTTSIIAKLKAQKRAFLVDTSGSMYESVKDGTKIQIVNGLLDTLKNELQLTRLFTFSDYCEEIQTSKLVSQDKISLYPGGGTAMHKAFEKMHQSGIKDIVLLTDGQPDLEGPALSAAQGLKIDIVYIGPQPMPEFLKRLASATGGSFQDQDMLKDGSSKLLTGKIKGLLGK